MRLAAFVCPKSRPTIQATRSNLATATRPQFRPPITTRTAAETSNVFIGGLLSVEVLFRVCTIWPTPVSRVCTISVREGRLAQMSKEGVLRIGELSRRVGVSPEVLRAWERRYGVLRPTRTEGGFRLYSTADEARVRRMLALQQQGLSPAVAARTANAEDGSASGADE